MTYKYSIDTRTIQPGECFVAIRGERYDGHDFIPQATAKGATALVVETELSDLTIPPNVTVKNVNDSIQFLAREARKRIDELQPDVIAITGSVGKTTTRRAVATVLREEFSVVTPEGNWNTSLGLSLTILNELAYRNQKLVVEIGTYQMGTIAHVCLFVPPSIAVVTNIHPVHLESMGTIRNIMLAKRELVEAITPNGVACLNWDDPRVRRMSGSCQGRVLTYGIRPGASISPERIRVSIPLPGSYNIYPALAAFCVGHCLGLPDNTINEGLSRLTPEKGRLNQLPGVNGSIIIDDTYNASPISSFAALALLKDQLAKRRIAFLGDMLELGGHEIEAHHSVLEIAVDVADQVILVGPRFSYASKHIILENPESLFAFGTSDDATAALADEKIYHPKDGDCILIKGSAGMRLEKIVQHMLHPSVDPTSVLVRQEPGWRDL